MYLWIRSQDKEKLVLTKGFELQCPSYDNGCQIFAVWQNNYQCIGNYKTKERALEILDEIQNILRPTLLLNGCSIDDETLKDLKLPKNAIKMSTHDNATITYSGSYVYEMPQE